MFSGPLGHGKNTKNNDLLYSNSAQFLHFLKVATSMVGFLFIELMPQLSNVKQMYSQPMHLTHELILCIQITKGRVDI